MPGLAFAVSGTSSSVPTSAQISQTQAEVSQYESTLAHEQAQTAALDQEYDAAQQQLQNLTREQAATAAAIAVTRAKYVVDKRELVHDAVNAYVLDTPDNAFTSLFSSPATTSDERTQYVQAAVGNVSVAADTLATEEGKLNQQAAQQKSEAQQAETSAQHVQSLEAANATATQQAQATLAQVKGTLSNEIAAAALAQAQREAAAAAAARNAAAARAAAESAQQAASVAASLGSSGQASAAAAAANEAAASAAGGAPTNVSASGGSTAGGLAAVRAAESQLGVPYVYGGEAPGEGFDCSGLTQWSWAQVGVSIPRVAADQYDRLPRVPLNELEPGDLLFYYNLDGDYTVDHVVMYVGSGPYGANTIIQAPYTGSTVSYAPLFTSGLVGAGRP